MYISVVGSSVCDGKMYGAAVEVGREIARRGHVLLCGGLGGVMEGACRGASDEGGVTVGILPGISRLEGNPYLSYGIATGMGEARNAIVARAADAVIAVGGGFGTLSEVALALKWSKPVVSIGPLEVLGGGGMLRGLLGADSPEEAVEKLEGSLTGR